MISTWAYYTAFLCGEKEWMAALGTELKFLLKLCID